jgi:uncharacterized protein (DUF1800 family)
MRPILLAGWLRLSALILILFAAPTAPLHAIVDENADGWSDIWQIAYGFGLDPDADPDNDGRTNWQEHNEGTDPFDPDSKLATPLARNLPKNRLAVSWPSVAGKLYHLQVSFDGEKWSYLGTPVIGTGQTIERIFHKPKTFLTGEAPVLRWTDVDGTTIDTIATLLADGVAPAETIFTNDLERPQTSPDESRFAQIIRGHIIAPADGSYRFWIASDDSSELWLSTSASPARKKLIASVTGHTSFRQWNRFPDTQVSQFITLKGGQRYFFEVLHKEGFGGDHVSVAWTGPGLHPTREIIGAAYVNSDNDTLAKKLARNRNPQYRLLVSDVDPDNDGLTSWEELVIGLDPQNSRTVTRVNDINTVRTMLAATNTITIGTAQSRAYEKEGTPAIFTVFRTGNINPITVNFTLDGEAVAGEDFAPLAGTVQFATGQTSANFEVLPIADTDFEPAETLTATIEPGTAYEIGSPSSATVTIDDAADIIYVASLRGSGKKTGGYGTASLRVAGNEAFGELNISFGNLSSPQINTVISISIPGAGSVPVLVLPAGQVAQYRWEFDAIGGATRAQILAALREGKAVVTIRSEASTDGEIAGPFLRTWGSKKQIKPPAPPATVTRARNEGEAARFLEQAAFGPTQQEIARVRRVGYPAWIQDQFKKRPTLHLPYVQARRAQLLAESGGSNDGWQTPRQEAWWQAALAAPDQLRQRVAFALSQIFVVSDIGVLDSSHEGITNYYDMLVKHAFGNYRNLLEDVTLSPIMGQYLSMVRNQKPNPDSGSQPDENYAREVMQLLSIGLNMLNQDGSLKLDADGRPIATYTQDDIAGLAHVFTGWGYAYDEANPPSNLDNFFRYGARNEMLPMVMFPNFHDTKAKRLINGVVVPPGLTGEQDLKIALDTLFKHPNVGPFMARQLIQRLVTSNPSRGYIYRVASVFNNNGNGVRGDLKATVKAVLLDPEARNPALQSSIGYGKLREPLLRVAHLLRAFEASRPLPDNDRYYLDLQYTMPQQAPLKSPSVFNFFQPGYTHPGPIARSGLYSPEFQITSETSVVNLSNVLYSNIIGNGISTNGGVIRLDYAPYIELLKREGTTLEENIETIIDRLDTLLCAGKMSPNLRNSLRVAQSFFPSNYGTTDDHYTRRVRAMLYVVAASPEYVVQK